MGFFFFKIYIDHFPGFSSSLKKILQSFLISALLRESRPAEKCWHSHMDMFDPDFTRKGKLHRIGM